MTGFSSELFRVTGASLRVRSRHRAWQGFDRAWPLGSTRMERPVRFEHFRYLGDKRSQIVHDLDTCDEPEVIAELMAAETFLCFGPDTLPEARNRGYRLCRRCARARGQS